jgi:hypothetical protein
VGLYAYALQVTSSRRLEQRIREDRAFRYLAGGATPDPWTLNAFRTRHGGAINDLFLQVGEAARGLGMGCLGHVAMDSRRVEASASRRRTETGEELRQRRAKTPRAIRRWQQPGDAADPDEEPGTQIDAGYGEQLQQALAERRAKLAKVWKLGARQLSRTDADSRFFSVRNLQGLEGRGIEGYLPEAPLRGELPGRRGPLKRAGDSPEHGRLRACAARRGRRVTAGARLGWKR